MSLMNLSITTLRMALIAKHKTVYNQSWQANNALNTFIDKTIHSSTILSTLQQTVSADEIADNIGLQLSDDLDFKIDKNKIHQDSNKPDNHDNIDQFKGLMDAILGPITAALTLSKLEQTIISIQTKCKSTMPFWAAFKASLGASYTKNVSNAPKDQLTETLNSQMGASIVAGSADTLLSSWFNVKKTLLQLDPSSRIVKQPTVNEMLQLSQKGLGTRCIRNNLNSASLMTLAPLIQQAFPQQWQQDYKHSINLASSIIAGMISGVINTPIDTIGKQIVASIDFNTLKTQPAKEVAQQATQEMYQDGFKKNARLAGLNAVRSAGGFMALATTGIITQSIIDYNRNTSNQYESGPHQQLA